MPQTTSSAPLVACRAASVTLAGRKALDRVTVSLERGQTWLVLGANGSGKSTLLRLLRGDIWPDDDGVGQRLFYPDPRPGQPTGQGRVSPLGLRHRFGLVSPERTRTLCRIGGHLPAGECVLAGARDSLYVQGPPTAEEARRLDEVLTRLALGPLTDTPVAALSNGQLRAVLLARALMRRPLALFLDEFLDGLDATAEELAGAAVAGAAGSGATVVVTSHRPLTLPVSVVQALVLDRGQVTDTGPAAAVLARRRQAAPARVAPGPVAPGPVPAPTPADPDLPLVVIENVTVVRGGRPVLTDVSLTVRPGEHLALLGANGSGKSTLLGLIAGEHHPAVGGTIRRPGLAAPEGLTDLRDIRRRIGQVSFELEAAYEKEVTGLELVVSGFAASIGLHAAPAPWQLAQARAWLARLDAADLAERTLGALSAGQTRRLFLARAMVAGPRLLLLDEPFAGLDAACRREAMATVASLARSGVTVLCAVHQPADIIAEIGRLRRLEQGRLGPETPVSSR